MRNIVPKFKIFYTYKFKRNINSFQNYQLLKRGYYKYVL